MLRDIKIISGSHVTEVGIGEDHNSTKQSRAATSYTAKKAVSQAGQARPSGTHMR